jgi:hypothetical protein
MKSFILWDTALCSLLEPINVLEEYVTSTFWVDKLLLKLNDGIT